MHKFSLALGEFVIAGTCGVSLCCFEADRSTRPGVITLLVLGVTVNPAALLRAWRLGVCRNDLAFGVVKPSIEPTARLVVEGVGA
jgi:hypothetical protein